MSPEEDGTGTGESPTDDEDLDMGAPIVELGTLEEYPAPGFFSKIRRRIEVRKLGSDVTELSLTGLVMVFLELVGTLFGMAQEKGPSASNKQAKENKDE